MKKFEAVNLKVGDVIRILSLEEMKTVNFKFEGDYFARPLMNINCGKVIKLTEKDVEYLKRQGKIELGVANGQKYNYSYDMFELYSVKKDFNIGLGRIEFIMLLREITGCGLVAAKQTCDFMLKDHMELDYAGIKRAIQIASNLQSGRYDMRGNTLIEKVETEINF